MTTNSYNTNREERSYEENRQSEDTNNTYIPQNGFTLSEAYRLLHEKNIRPEYQDPLRKEAC